MNKRGIDILGSVLLATLAFCVGGCSGDTDFVPSGIPTGKWFNESTYSIGGTPLTRRSYLTLRSQTQGTLVDTIFALRDGEWTVDSALSTELRFESVGDGYQRTYEIYDSQISTPDTSLRYWYMFRRNDSLYYYIGMRFVGENSGLIGSWRSDGRDVGLVGGCSLLTFTSDSVTVADGCDGSSTSRPTYSYKTNRDTITIAGRQLYGTRYEVVPGWSLYLTTRTTTPYRSIK